MPNVLVQSSRFRLVILALAILLPWLALLQPVHQINHDVAWFYYVARGVMQGGTLYKDFIEPNAPLASLSLTPAVLLAKALAISPDRAVEILVLGVASVAMALSTVVLLRLRLSTAALLFSLAALTTCCLFFPNAEFGQREHILAMLLTPYILGCVAACEGVQLPFALAAAIGVAGAVAVGVKPPFIFVPAALELTVILRTGIKAAWRVQPLMLAAGLAMNIATTLLFFPLYASEVVPWAVALYGGDYNAPVQLWGLIGLELYIGIALWLCWGSGGPPLARTARLCIAVAALGALGAFVLQGKGWFYHVLPCAFFLLLLNAGAIAVTGVWPGASPGERGRWLVARLFALGFVWNMISATYASVDLSRYAGVEQAILAENGPFVILSSNVDPGFPMVLKLNRVWASRMPCLIMLPGLVDAAAKGLTSPWEAMFRGWISSDLLRYKPNLIFLPPKGDGFMPPDFDVLPWLLRDPAFASIWAHYHQDGVRDGFRVFRLS